MANKNHLLWAPDIIKESNGTACGDMLLLSVYRDNNKILLYLEGCVCK